MGKKRVANKQRKDVQDEDDSKKANIQAHSIVYDPNTGKAVDLSNTRSKPVHVPPPKPSSSSSNNTTTTQYIRLSTPVYKNLHPPEFIISWFDNTLTCSREFPCKFSALCSLFGIKNTTSSLTQEYYTKLDNYIRQCSKKSHFDAYNTDSRANFDEPYKRTLIDSIELETKDIITSPLFHVEENVELLQLLTSSSLVTALCVLPFVKRLAVVCLQSWNISKFVYAQGIQVLVTILQQFAPQYKQDVFAREVLIEVCFLSYQVCKVDYDTRCAVKRMGLFFELWKLAAEEPGVMRYNANEAISEFSEDISSVGQELKAFVNHSLYHDMKLVVQVSLENEFLDTVLAHFFLLERRCSKELFEQVIVQNPSQPGYYMVKKSISRKALLYFLQFVYSDSMEYLEEDRDRRNKTMTWEEELQQGNINELAKYLFPEARSKFNHLLTSSTNPQRSEEQVSQGYTETTNSSSWYSWNMVKVIPIEKQKKLNGKQIDKQAAKYSLILEKDLYTWFAFHQYKSSHLDDLLPCEAADRIFKVPKRLQYGEEELLVEEEEQEYTYYKVHCLILAARSEYFKKLLSSGFIESESQMIDIENCSSNAFEVVVRYLYCGEEEFQFQYDQYQANTTKTVKHCSCDINQSNAIEILIVSHMFMLPTLKCKAEKEVVQGVTKSNAYILLQFAEDYNASTVESACKKLLPK